MSREAIYESLARETEAMRQAGTFKRERVLESAQGAHVRVGGRDLINMCANNYLGLAAHPTVVAAARESLDAWGYGLASVRFICGTQRIHRDLESRISRFVGKEETILYGSCWDANGGLF
ncbi:MAG: aminotransferase class I/II-fold pyridoxal phosphate-dependent enzyme, partial [Planctomycetaceae bacterium]